MDDIEKVRAMIAARDPASQRRIHVVAQLLRELIAKDDKAPEVELAFTMVMAEVAS